jgi:hypothetical protein
MAEPRDEMMKRQWLLTSAKLTVILFFIIHHTIHLKL